MAGEPSKSGIWMPLVVGGEATGVISLQNLDREHAFTESDLQLLATLARSLSVALENARLLDETRQRAAELAIVNSVGQALSAHLDLPSLIDLVGERMRETFDADIVYVALHEPASDIIDFPYYSELGKRITSSPIAFGEGLTSRILQSRAPLLLNRAEHFEEIGTRGLGVPAESYLGVPIMAGETAIGVISVQSSVHQGRFGETDVRLLSTIAANVGVAIQNAQLYEETRRRGDEMAALAEVGRELSAAVDMAAVLERIAERAKDLLEADTSAVYLAEPENQTFRATVALGENAAEIKADRIVARRGNHRRPRRPRRGGGGQRRDRRPACPHDSRHAGGVGGAAHGRAVARPRPGDRHDSRLALRPEELVHRGGSELPRRPLAAGGRGDRERAAVRGPAGSRAALPNARRGAAVRALRRRACERPDPGTPRALPSIGRPSMSAPRRTR